MFETIAFYFFSAFSLGCFGVSVFSRNILYAMSALAGGMVFVSGLFFLLGAEFLGVVQIIVYTGAVMVLYAFSMMFFDVSTEISDAKPKASLRLIYVLSGFIALLLVLIFAAPVVGQNLANLSSLAPNSNVIELGNVEQIGLLLFSKYLLVFEMVAVMLLVAMVAGIVLVHKNMDAQTEIEEIL